MWQVDSSDVAEDDPLRLNKPDRERMLKYFRERVQAILIQRDWRRRSPVLCADYGDSGLVIVERSATFKKTS
jgi:hypothetical protein